VQVSAFKTREAEILKKSATHSGNEKTDVVDNPIAKVLEEMKALPSRVVERLSESEGPIFRGRRGRRTIHPMIFEEIHRLGAELGDPVTVLMAASLVRDDFPWLYELATEVYRAVKSDDQSVIENEFSRLRHFLRFLEVDMHPRLLEQLGVADKESAFILTREFPRMLLVALERALVAKRHAKSETKKT
jgi:hypothetical protein